MPRGSPRMRTQDNKLNQIGERLKEGRSRLNITQDALCARISQATDGQWIPDRREIYRIEDGRRIVSDLELLVIADVLGCSPSWLLIGDPTSFQ